MMLSMAQAGLVRTSFAVTAENLPSRLGSQAVFGSSQGSMDGAEQPGLVSTTTTSEARHCGGSEGQWKARKLQRQRQRQQAAKRWTEDCVDDMPAKAVDEGQNETTLT
jgi:hypothetical protein